MHKSDFQTWSVFFLAVILLGGSLMVLGCFQPETQFDTKSYQEFPFDNLVEALNNQRTFVYPSFLYAIQLLNESNAIVPICQFVFAVFSCSVWMLVLKRIGWDDWLSVAATLPILTSTLVLEYCHLLTPDLFAQSMGVLVVSFWLACVYRRAGWIVYGLLSASVFLAYQTKPSYLFLMGFVPVGGAIARWWLFGMRRDVSRVGLQLAAASVLPFLAWCSMRWYFVGHFGLVSFGGYNVIGIAGQLLDLDVVPRLSSDIQPLASDILDRRGQKVGWESRYSYSVFESQYNPMVWDLAVPAASKQFDGDSRQINFALSKLSKETIMQRPLGYVVWLVLAAKRAITLSVELVIRNPCVILAIGMMLFAHARRWRLLQGAVWRDAEIKNRSTADSEPCNALEYQTIVWMSLGYAFCSLMLVILVEAPISRYCAPAIVFVPSLLCMLGVDMLRRN